MARFQNRILLGVASVAFLVAISQHAEARRRGARFGGVSEVQLASLAEVQKELNLTDEQKQKAAELNDELRSEMQEAFQSARDAGGDFTAVREKLQKSREKASAKFVVLLEEPQQTRLREIFVQVNGPAALRHKDVAAALKLADDQKQKLEDVTAEGMDAIRDAFEDLRDASREERREKMAELNEKTDEKLLAVLTTEQSDAFGKMKGKEIELDMSQLYQRRN